jgi:type 1 fimbria pilin
MRTSWKLLGACVVFALALTVVAADKDSSSPSGSEVTIKGTIACAKCTFKVDGQKDCNIAIKDKEGTIYYFDADSHKKWMGKDAEINFCTIQKEGSVTGVVTKKDGKSYIHVNKLKAD